MNAPHWWPRLAAALFGLLLLALAVVPLSAAAREPEEVARYTVLLSDDSAVVRKRAAIALGDRGAEAEAAVPALNKALTDPDPGVRAAVAEALEKIEKGLKAPPPPPAKEMTLKGHDGPVAGVAFTPDGRRVASSGRDGTVRIWDAVTGQEVTAFRAGAEPTYGLDISPDGKLVATSGDHAVRVWKINGGDQPLTVKLHPGDYIGAVAFSPDSKRFVSCGRDKMVRVCDAATGKELLTLAGHTGDVYTASYSPDGKLIVSGSDDGTARVWDAISGETVCVFKGHAGAVYGTAFSPDGKRVVSGGLNDQTVKMWDARTGDHVVTLTGHPAGVRGVAWSPDGKVIASAGQDPVIKLWDARAGKLLATLEGHPQSANRVAFSPDSRRLVSSGFDGTVRLWAVPQVRP